jgi:hypothetical protein
MPDGILGQLTLRSQLELFRVPGIAAACMDNICRS